MFSASYSRGMTNIQDPYYNNVSLLMHMNGSNNGVSFTDSSKNNLSISVSGAVTSTAQSKFGGSSAYFNGSSHLQINDTPELEFGTSNFTMEAWVYLATNDTTAHAICSKDTVVGTVGSNTGREWIWRINRSISRVQFITFDAPVGGTTIIALSDLYTFNQNVWNHLAISRIATTVYFFINGDPYGSGTCVNNIQSQTSNIRIGSGFFSGSEFRMNGYIDELRITKGIARFSNKFSPQGVQFLP